MQLQYNDEVFFIHNNTIYKGLIKGDEVTPNTTTLYRVKSALGLTLIKEWALHTTLDRLVQAITYEEPVSVNGEFKTWSVN